MQQKKLVDVNAALGYFFDNDTTDITTNGPRKE
jgi:hypothetical protein